jgi:hypothetical protein
MRAKPHARKGMHLDSDCWAFGQFEGVESLFDYDEGIIAECAQQWNGAFINYLIKMLVRLRC